MKQFCLFTIILFLAGACTQDHRPAMQRLENARAYLAQQEFDKAKAEIDSLNKLHPKSFDQRKAGIPLLDSIRKAENIFIIADMDQQLEGLEPVLEKMKADFVFQKDEKYQETGAYIPKALLGSGVLSYTTLHAGVEEDGRIYLESIYIGGQKHNQLKVTAGDSFAETLPVDEDGFAHRFTDLGKTYEVIKFIGESENHVARFVAENADSNLKVQLSGQHTTTYALPKNIKEAIKKSVDLSSQMLLIDSLKTVKEQAEFKNFYLDNGRQTSVAVEE